MGVVTEPVVEKIFHTSSLLQIHVNRVQNTVFQLNKSSLHIVDSSLLCPGVHVKEQLLHAAMLPCTCSGHANGVSCILSLMSSPEGSLSADLATSFLLKFIITREKTSDIEKGISDSEQKFSLVRCCFLSSFNAKFKRELCPNL